MVVVWLCYSPSCIEINFECGLDVGSMKGRCRVNVVEGKYINCGRTGGWVSKTLSFVLKRASLPLLDFKSQASLSLFLKHHELTNESILYFLIKQSKTQTFTDLKATKNL